MNCLPTVPLRPPLRLGMDLYPARDSVSRAGVFLTIR